MKKQTAVEWLIDQICTDVEMYDEYGNVSHIEFWNAFRSCTDLSEYISVAKAMEKEQIIFSFIEGALISEKLESKPYTFINYAEQYYNETFKSE